MKTLLDDLPSVGLADYLEGMIIQSDLPPPDFVDPALVQDPDIVWHWTDRQAQVLAPRKRLYRHAVADALPVMPPLLWQARMRAAKAGKPRQVVAEALAQYADHQGRNVRPANVTIAKALGKSRETVNRAVKALVTDGWLVDTGKAELGVIVYALTVPEPKNVTQTISNLSAA